jgi:hypothetical protein
MRHNNRIRMREKYIEERFKRYFIFGENPATGTVDVYDGNEDIAPRVPRDVAEKIISDRDDVLNMLVSLALEFDRVNPEAFKKLWYGDDDLGEWTKGYRSGYRAGRNNSAHEKLDGTSDKYRSAYLHGYECGHRYADV